MAHASSLGPCRSLSPSSASTPGSHSAALFDASRRLPPSVASSASHLRGFSPRSSFVKSSVFFQIHLHRNEQPTGAGIFVSCSARPAVAGTVRSWRIFAEHSKNLSCPVVPRSYPPPPLSQDPSCPSSLFNGVLCYVEASNCNAVKTHLSFRGPFPRPRCLVQSCSFVFHVSLSSIWSFFFFFFHGTRKENHFIFSLEPNRVFASTGRLGSIGWVVCASSLICGVTAGVYIKPLCGREPYPVLSHSASLVCLSIAAQTPRF